MRLNKTTHLIFATIIFTQCPYLVLQMSSTHAALEIWISKSISIPNWVSSTFSNRWRCGNTLFCFSHNLHINLNETGFKGRDFPMVWIVRNTGPMQNYQTDINDIIRFQQGCMYKPNVKILLFRMLCHILNLELKHYHNFQVTY